MNLDFPESAAMARKIVKACLDTQGSPYFEPYVLAVLEEKIKDKESLVQCADTQRDLFGDCFSLMRFAVEIVDKWENLWSDSHHNGRPLRWIPFGETLAMQGKTSSLVVKIKDRQSIADLIARPSDAAWKETWEFHQRDRAAKEYSWQKSAFAVTVRSGKWVESIEPVKGPKRPGAGEPLLGGLEVLGYKTPVYRY